MKRIAGSTVVGVLIIGAAALSAGCASPAGDAPSTPVNSVQPTEKGAIKPPPRAFSPSMNAADGISALESEGYNVEINWGGGRTDQNLSLCRIGGVDGMRGSGAVKPGTSVYVTVIC